MKYIDMHCDSVTRCFPVGGKPPFAGQVDAEKLSRAGCMAQCFAIFTEGENAAGDFEKFSAFYFDFLDKNRALTPAYCLADIKKAEKAGGTAAILTVENAGFLGGDISGFSRLKDMGVEMLSLVWNTPNLFAFPNFDISAGKSGRGDIGRSGARLTDIGRAAVEELNRLKIIIDISHLSDGGAEDVLALSEAPVAASHSNAFAVCPSPRNLTDAQLKAIADGGGVVGLNFHKPFLGSGGAFDLILAHYRHIVDVAGEDCPAIGSDFDGIPAYEEMKDCTVMPRLIEFFGRSGVKSSALEKLCYGNFLRVFKEVVG